MFSRHRIEQILLQREIGNAIEEDIHQLNISQPISVFAITFRIRQSVVRFVRDGLELTFECCPGEIKGFMSMPNAKFAEAVENVMEQADAQMDLGLKIIWNKGVGRMFFDIRFEKFYACVTAEPSDSRALEKVWFTPAEVENFVDAKALKEEWATKLAKMRAEKLRQLNIHP